MQKYGASGARDDRVHIVADDRQHVVQPVLSPHPFGAGRIGKGDEAIVIAVRRVVDPTVVRGQRPRREARGWGRDPVWAVKHGNERVAASWRGAVALAFISLDPVAPDRRTSAAPWPVQLAVVVFEIIGCRWRSSRQMHRYQLRWKREKASTTDQSMYWPPLIDRVEPVIKPAPSATRNNTARAISSGLPRRPTGTRATICSSTFCDIARTMSVST